MLLSIVSEAAAWSAGMSALAITPCGVRYACHVARRRRLSRKPAVQQMASAA